MRVELISGHSSALFEQVLAFRIFGLTVGLVGLDVRIALTLDRGSF